MGQALKLSTITDPPRKNPQESQACCRSLPFIRTAEESDRPKPASGASRWGRRGGGGGGGGASINASILSRIPQQYAKKFLRIPSAWLCVRLTQAEEEEDPVEVGSTLSTLMAVLSRRVTVTSSIKGPKRNQPYKRGRNGSDDPFHAAELGHRRHRR